MKADRPSHTAGTVAQSLLILSHDPVYQRLVPRDAVAPTRWLLEAARGGWVRLLDNPLVVAFARAYERVLLPGIFVHHAARKVWIERKVRTALSGGTEQVLVLGGGYDTLTWRLHPEYPAVRFWEVDHPATQAIKRRVMQERSAVGPNLHLAPANLAVESLRDVTARLEGYSCDRDTVAVIEGVLMYLDEEEVVRTIGDIRACVGSRSLLLGTVLRPDADAKPSMGSSRRTIDWMLRRSGESFRSALHPGRMLEILEQAGFDGRTREVSGFVAEQVPGEGRPPRLPTGEYLFEARPAEPKGKCPPCV